MERANVKLGQKVRVNSAELFYSFNVGKQGVVTELDGDYVHVIFEDGDDDFGYASALELLSDSKPEAASVKEAIANVEAALEALKALVG